MEVVGTVAALVALTKDIAIVCDSLVRHFLNAPKELVQLRNQISLVLLELSYLEQFGVAESLETFLPTGELRLLLHAMQIAQNEIAATHEELRLTANPVASKTTTSARLTWALFDRKSVGGALAQLERVEGRLICLLQLVNLRMNIDLRRDNVTFGTQILDELKTQRMQTVSRRPEPKESFLSAEETAIQSETVFRHNYTFVLADFWSKVFGSEVELTTSNNEYQRAYDIYAKLLLPAFTGRKAFLVTLSMRRAWGFWPNVSLLGGGLNFVNIIPMESEIVAACRRGDIVAVRTLFSERKAAPNDMTSESGTLIYHATESGSTKLVQFLIDAGASLQPRQLLRAAWRRQPDIARTLLRTKRVDVETLYLDGDTAASILYGKNRPRQQQTEFLSILASHSFSQFSAQDAYGWNVLHRAASWGTAADVTTLLKFGTLRSLRTRSLGWTPLFCAVASRNTETLQALFDSSGVCELSDEKDFRGWNLLHVAVAYNNFDALPYLLEKGVDPGTTSTTTSCHVPELIKERSVTPGQMARTFGECTYRKWAEGLESAGRTIDIRPEEIDWASEETKELLWRMRMLRLLDFLTALSCYRFDPAIVLELYWDTFKTS